MKAIKQLCKNLTNSIKNAIFKQATPKSTPKGRPSKHLKPIETCTSDASNIQQFIPVLSSPSEEACFTIRLKNHQQEESKRRNMRINVEGLEAYIPRLKSKFIISDLSETGVSFSFPKPRIRYGAQLTLSLQISKDVLIENIHCTVMRHNRGTVGCLFLSLTSDQRIKIKKILTLNTLPTKSK